MITVIRIDGSFIERERAGFRMMTLNFLNPRPKLGIVSPTGFNSPVSQSFAHISYYVQEERGTLENRLRPGVSEPAPSEQLLPQIGAPSGFGPSLLVRVIKDEPASTCHEEMAVEVCGTTKSRPVC